MPTKKIIYLFLPCLILTACQNKEGTVDEFECKHGIAASCLSWGKKFEKSNPAKAMNAFQKTCDLENTNGCLRLAEMLKKSEPRRAQKLYKYACDRGNTRACVKYADFLNKQR